MMIHGGVQRGPLALEASSSKSVISQGPCNPISRGLHLSLLPKSQDPLDSYTRSSSTIKLQHPLRNDLIMHSAHALGVSEEELMERLTAAQMIEEESSGEEQTSPSIQYTYTSTTPTKPSSKSTYTSIPGTQGASRTCMYHRCPAVSVYSLYEGVDQGKRDQDASSMLSPISPRCTGLSQGLVMSGGDEMSPRGWIIPRPRSIIRLLSANLYFRQRGPANRLVQDLGYAIIRDQRLRHVVSTDRHRLLLSWSPSLDKKVHGRLCARQGFVLCIEVWQAKAGLGYYLSGMRITQIHGSPLRRNALRLRLGQFLAQGRYQHASHLDSLLLHTNTTPSPFPSPHVSDYVSREGSEVEGREEPCAGEIAGIGRFPLPPTS